jgi:membrane protease subunit HflK
MAWDWDKLQQQKKSSSGGGGENPPGIDDIIAKFRGAKGGIPNWFWVVIVIVAIIILAYSSIFTIEPNERGIIQRFGKHVRTAQPGLNFKFPKGIEKLTKVKVDFTYKVEFGFRTIEAGVQTRYAPSSSRYLQESLMLTGGLNVALVQWIVQYRIQNPHDYLFKVRDVTATLRALSEAVMRLVVGDRSVDEVIIERKELTEEAEKLLQEELDTLDAGIMVKDILLKQTHVPEPVQPSFNEVNQSIQEKERMIYQARQEYNKVIPAARGQAEKTIRAAEGYALDRVNRAKGDATRFLALYSEYKKARDVTRRRLYLEAILEIFPNMGEKYIIDEDLKSFLPLLNLKNSEGGAQ